MPRLRPDSIRARISWMLVAGMVGVLLLAVVIAGVSVSGDGSAWHDSVEATMAVLAVAADELPPAQRPVLYRASEQAGVILRPTSPGRLVDDTFTRSMAGRLRERLGPSGIGLLEVGHEAARPRTGITRWWQHGGDIVARVRLEDGSELEIARPARWSLPAFLAQAAPVLLAVALGLALLGVWVARRVTSPLERFALAAERLGRDARSPPLDEAGPREIRRAARVLNRTQQRVQRLLDDRMQMLAAIAHDLRTPLMRLQLRAELLPEPEQQRRMRDDLAEMEQMIDAALAFAREETVVETRQPVDLGTLLADLGDDLREAGRDVTVMAGQPVTVHAAPGALKRALGNLLENAARYGERAGVTWQAHADRVEVYIDDDGPGIDESEFERVFMPFYRLERSRSRNSGGTGLGMTVARTVVRGHGGDVTLARRASGGLRQTVVLPRGLTP